MNMSNAPSSSDKPTTTATTSKPSVGPPTHPVVLELVYENLISSVSIDVACKLHRMMKKGIYPSSELLVPKNRNEIYPEIYETKTVEDEEKRYAVVVPKRPKRKRAGETEETAYEAYVRQTTTATTTPDAAVSSNNTNDKQPPTPSPPPPPHYLDIWGKAPPKEPKEMVDCLICGRQVNTLRFAPHLDKCMGIGTTVRAAALAASGFVPQQALSAVTGTSVSRGNSSAVGSHKYS